MTSYVPSDAVVGEFLSQLSSALRSAKGERPTLRVARETGINRSKLSELERERTLNALTPGELIALNAFVGGKLVEILRDLAGTTLLDLLREAAGITLILGAEHASEDCVSRFDLAALGAIVRSVETPGARSHETRIEVARPWQPGDGRTPGPLERSTERWLGALDQPDARAIVTIGSPTDSAPSEVMLCRMLGEEPFTKPRARLPFELLWHSPPDAPARSTFARVAERDDGTVPASGLLGIRVRDTVYSVNERSHARRSYGVGVAQRRASGQLWLVLFGTTGCATQAIAELLGDARGVLPPAGPGPGSLPTWFLVEEEGGGAEFRRASPDGLPEAAPECGWLINGAVWDPKTQTTVTPTMLNPRQRGLSAH